ncbi:MAG: argininosuccinate lyase [Clostridia bacterium]|nr:argininosuccinate lyase [Clostridia bacterium]
MSKLWEGRTDGKVDPAADDFNSSIRIDGRMYRRDVEGSIAHAEMLAKQGIIPDHDAEQIEKGLLAILADIENGVLAIDPKAEDIHTFIEQELTRRVGDAGKRLHTARSRNDQVALDSRLYLRDEGNEITALLKELVASLCARAEENKAVIMPGYTHLQRAQPITFGHHLCAYCFMFLRDVDRFGDALKRMNVSPIGSCALAGTTFPTDRGFEAAKLGFDGVCENSVDGVSDRDFCIELASCSAIAMMHLSRFSEELILWSSREFGFVTISDEYTTGSSIMPQKKNPDMAELVRGKTGRVYGDLMALLTVMKGLPLAYNKDMQEDKEAIFDSLDTLKACLGITAAVVKTFKVNAGAMSSAASEGFINATDFADYLAVKGVPFREAYKIAGRAVGKCIEKGLTLETLPFEDYRALCPAVDEKVYDAVDLANCASRRNSEGGTSVASVEKQLAEIRKRI